jgi:hypothetical protein
VASHPAEPASCPADHILELNCLVLSNHLSHSFAIKILATKTINALKKVIKDENKPYFDHVPAHSLDIYKFQFPQTHNPMMHYKASNSKMILRVVSITYQCP